MSYPNLENTDMRTPTSVELFRQQFKRAPSAAEMRACIDYAHPPKTAEPVSNGCDCYDQECTLCCDEQGNVRQTADKQPLT